MFRSHDRKDHVFGDRLSVCRPHRGGCHAPRSRPRGATDRTAARSRPAAVEEIRADKDLLRADFAMSTRRLEIIIEQLKSKTTSQLVELGTKGDAINRLKVERDALKVEIVALKTQVEAAAYSTEMGTQASLVPAIPTIRQSMQEDTPPLQPLSRVVSQSDQVF